MDDVNVEDVDGKTPLHLLCSEDFSYEEEDGNRSQIAKLLIDKDADLNVKDRLRRTPLHLACMNGHLKLAGVLIEHGVDDVNAKDQRGETALHMGCQNFYFETQMGLVKLLIEHGADVKVKDDEGLTPLHRACENGGYVEVVKHLLGRGADVSLEAKDGRKPLEIASEGNHLDVVWFLVRQYPWLVEVEPLT